MIQTTIFTKNFTLAELTATSYKDISNIPSQDQINNLQYLAEMILQPTRDRLNQPIRVTSGFRSEELNRRVGGSPSSFHSLGCAADLELADGSFWPIFKIIYSELPYTELIAENVPDGWCHVAIQKGREDEKQLKVKEKNRGVRRATIEEILSLMPAARDILQEK